MFGKFGDLMRGNKRKLELEDVKELPFKQGDLVNYKFSDVVTYMAIINEVDESINGNPKYKINIIDKAWNNPLVTETVDIAKISKINLQPEYNPDLFIEIKNEDKIKKMIELKLGVKALKANIDFINANPDAFSDFALPDKIRALQGLQKQLTDLYHMPNEIEPTYVTYNTKLYGNIILQISNYCDTLNLNVEIKEQIIENFLNVSNSLLSFTGITLGLNVLYYKFYGELLITSLFDKLPENIKQQIKTTLLQFLGIFIFDQRDFFYHLCNYPIDSIRNFYNLFNDNIIRLSDGKVNFSNNIHNISNNDDDDIRSEKRRKTIVNDYDYYKPLSQPDDFETKCITFKNDDIDFNKVNKEIFEYLNSEISDINGINETDIFPLGKGGKRNKKTRKINKKRRVIRKTKKTNKSYKKHNTKKRNTKRR